MNKLNKYYQSGFSLLELLVVISIIGVLAGLSLVSFRTAEQQARDTKRKSDLKQYQNLLEIYANRYNGLYPANNGGAVRADTTLCGYLSQTGCPADPKDNESICGTSLCRYYYQSNAPVGLCLAGGACATTYTLRASLENSSGIWVYCSNGKSGTVAAGTTFSNGACPLP